MDDTQQVSDSITDELLQRQQHIKPLTPRVKYLRDRVNSQKVTISGERALLLTEFYKTQGSKYSSVPIQRAEAFRYLMNHVSLPIENQQLIVGIRGSEIKAVPTYPEICCHSLDDLKTLSQRSKNPYAVSEHTIQAYKEYVIPFWKNKSIREKLFELMSSEWKNAFDAGVFTEFMEQRPPGHTAGDQQIFSQGLLDVKKRIKQKKKQIQLNEPNEKAKIDELIAMEITIDAMIHYAKRYVEKLQYMESVEKNLQRKQELQQMIKISQRVPKYAPRTFWEALQHYWYIHVGITTETNPWDSFSPGRLDQHLYTFYQRGLSQHNLTRDQAKELLELFWLKFNTQPAPPKTGVTAEESNTYNDFSKINLGGLNAEGNNAVNELSFLILEVLDEMRMVQPNTAALICEKTPDDFLKKCLDIIQPGFGEPPLLNHDVVVKQMHRQQKTQKDSLESGCSGCVESGAFGKESYILTGYMNLPKILEITMHNGKNPRTKKTVGIQTGEPSSFATFQDFYSAFQTQLQYFIDLKIKGNDTIEALYAERLPVPFLSLWIADCIDQAKDYNSGGARYNTQYIQFVGLGSITDALTSIKYHIYDHKDISWDRLLNAIQTNYQNDEELRQILLHKTPKFGNDDEYADPIAQDVFSTCITQVENHKPTPIRHASRHAYFLPTTAHVYFGSVCEARADGAYAYTPLSEGISPVQGADRHGIAAVLRSIGKLDHVRSGGTLLNQRISPDLLKDEAVKMKFLCLLRAYFMMGAHHIQFNVVSTELLRSAQQHPQEFRDLMVRVAGYSDYFVNLPQGLQDEIILRTQQSL